ncbi:MAG: hypothetical protein JXL80_16180 [Planctomycetes bacterium]|nr:hypothetical protein [Planctomycetota bacterium]
MSKWKVAIVIVLLSAVAAVAYKLALSKAEIDVYRSRLVELSGQYETLRSRYNEAVRKTAVTELIVRDGHLSLAIRTIEGTDRTIDTPFDPTQEIYCDYVLLDGRLWIRRVYDSRTPPREGLVIDDKLAQVDWSNPAARYGNAVYRSLGEGRWIVTVTGDGSLGLARVDDGTDVVLSAPPPVRDYDQLDKEIRDDLDHITVGDLLKRLF